MRDYEEARQLRPGPAPHFTEPLPGILADNGGTPTAVLRLTARGLLHGQAVYFSWDFMQLQPGQTPAQQPVGPQAINDFVTQYAANILTPLLAQSSVNMQLNDVLVTQISAYNVAATIITPSGYPKLGTTAGEALPQNEAYVVTKYTQHRGRRGRGRVFIPGAPIGSSNFGRMTTAYFNAINGNVWSKIGAGFTVSALSWTPCVTNGRVLKQPSNPAAWEAGVRGAVLTSYKIQLDYRTQRRRNWGRGI